MDYKGAQEQVEIICLKHGSFWQRAEDHWDGHGCSRCISRISAGESNWLHQNDIPDDLDHRQVYIKIPGHKWKVDRFYSRN
mgnify:CR=1 FL=1